MRNRFAAAVAASLFAILDPVAAEDDLSAPSQLLLDDLGEVLAVSESAYDRYEAYWQRDKALTEAAADDPELAMLGPVLRLEVGGELAAMFARNGLEMLEIDAPQKFEWTVQSLVAGASYAANASPPSRADLYRLGEAVDRLNAAGMAVSQLRETLPPAVVTILDKAIKLYKAGLSAEELANADKPARDRIVRDFLSLAPSGLNPQLNGLAGAAFADALDWNGRLWDATTDGVDLVADALERGSLDAERYAAVSDRLEELATKGPWDSATAATFFKQWATSLPGVGRFLKAVWPEPLPDQCKAINCDCDNLIMELFGQFRKACLETQNELIGQCLKTKTIKGICHPTARGPAAFPRG